MKSKKKVRHDLLPTGPGGYSFCSCGAKTGPTGTFAKQRQWHREHKRVEKQKAQIGGAK